MADEAKLDEAGYEVADGEPSGPSEYAERVKDLPEEDIPAEQYAETVQRKRQLDTEYSDKILFWGHAIFYFGFTISVFCLMNCMLGLMVVEIAATDCVKDLKGYVLGNVGMGFIWLIAFVWATIGPFPIHRIDVYVIFFAIWSFTCFILNVVGTSLLGGASPCEDTSPGLLSFAKWNVAQFWIGFFVALWYIGGHYGGIEYRKYEAKQKARREAEIQAEIDAEEAAGDDVQDLDEDEGDDVASPVSGGGDGDSGDDDDADEQGEDGQQDSPTS